MSVINDNDIKVDEDLLIPCVRSRPWLWDKWDPDYKDKWIVGYSWREVASCLHTDFESLSEVERDNFVKRVQKKWLNLRTSFKYYFFSKKKCRTECTTVQKKKDFRFEPLKFLERVIVPCEKIGKHKSISETAKNLVISPENSRATVQDAHSGKPLETLETPPSSSATTPEVSETDQDSWTAFHPQATFLMLPVFKDVLSSAQNSDRQDHHELQLGNVDLIHKINARKRSAKPAFRCESPLDSDCFPHNCQDRAQDIDDFSLLKPTFLGTEPPPLDNVSQCFQNFHQTPDVACPTPKSSCYPNLLEGYSCPFVPPREAPYSRNEQELSSPSGSSEYLCSSSSPPKSS